MPAGGSVAVLHFAAGTQSVVDAGLKAAQLAALPPTAVACLSGTAFGKHGDGFLRFSYANSVENIREALKRFAGFLQKARATAKT